MTLLAYGQDAPPASPVWQGCAKMPFAEKRFGGKSALNAPHRGSCISQLPQGQAACGGRVPRALTQLRYAFGRSQ